MECGTLECVFEEGPESLPRSREATAPRKKFLNTEERSKRRIERVGLRHLFFSTDLSFLRSLLSSVLDHGAQGSDEPAEKKEEKRRARCDRSKKTRVIGRSRKSCSPGALACACGEDNTAEGAGA